jgi:hypothetical protein
MDRISVILNVYKRVDTLEKQIEAIKNQSIGYDNIDIHVWYNKCDVEQFLPVDKNIKTYQANWNTKFWGRFTIPLICQTKYIAMFDDDILPGNNWLKNCVESIEKKDGIYGGSGVILHQKSYMGSSKVGWNAVHSNNIEQVDLVGHAWFFKQEHAKYLWYDKPTTWENGEDIMFSFLAQKYGNINTFVPPHPENDKSLWSSDFTFGAKYGGDINATFKNNTTHYAQRSATVIDCINNGWKTVKNIK